MRARAGPRLDEALGREDLQGVLGGGLPDAVPGDDAVARRHPGPRCQDPAPDLIAQILQHAQVHRVV